MHSTKLAISEFLFLNDEPSRVDLCVVLGCKYPETMDGAIDLWRRGWATRILITGHGPKEDQLKEADLFRDYALEQGVPDDVMIIEREARNTRDNFELSRPLVEWGGVKKVAIVGKPYHMRRALMTAQQFWPADIEYILLPSQLPQDLKAHNWWESEWGRTRVLDELRRIGEYGAKGDLAL